MAGRCKLCGEPVGSTAESVRCRCGRHFHDRCRGDHTCPNAERDGWVGAVEF